MKKIVPLGLGALLVLPLAFSIGADAQQDEEPTPLQQAMGELNGNMRKLRKLVESPADNQAVLLETVRNVQEAALAAFANPPTAEAGLAADDAAMWQAQFKRSVLALADTSVQMEIAVLSGDADGVTSAYAALGELKKSGHDTFKK
jgi:cytochrome c556